MTGAGTILVHGLGAAIKHFVVRGYHLPGIVEEEEVAHGGVLGAYYNVREIRRRKERRARGH